MDFGDDFRHIQCERYQKLEKTDDLEKFEIFKNMQYLANDDIIKKFTRIPNNAKQSGP